MHLSAFLLPRPGRSCLQERAWPVEILDVTLRDGGYVNNHEFGIQDIDSVIDGIRDAGIPFIEVGYFLRRGESGLPPVAWCPVSYLKRVNDRAGHVRIVCMVRPTMVAAEEIDVLSAAGVGVIRFVTSVEMLPSLERHISFARQQNLTVSINLTRCSELSLDKIVGAAALAEELGADWFYVADSNSAMFPTAVSEIFGALRRATRIRLGFHAHNSLQLAFANTLCALGAGATLIDCSIGGLGKAGGNLPTELIASYLKFSECLPYRIAPLRQAREAVIPWRRRVDECENLLVALLNVNVDLFQDMREISFTRGLPLLSILEELLDQNTVGYLSSAKESTKKHDGR
jgi:4-hydroxy 2-oxovalerate aldolase